MALITSLSNALKRFLTKEQIDSVDRVIRESDIAAERKLVAERDAKGPSVAAMAAAQVAADAERRAQESEALSKIARAAAKSASKRSKYYRKEASKAASRASAAEVDAAAKAAEAIVASQAAAIHEAEAIIKEHQRPA